MWHWHIWILRFLPFLLSCSFCSSNGFTVTLSVHLCFSEAVVVVDLDEYKGYIANTSLTFTKESLSFRNTSCPKLPGVSEHWRKLKTRVKVKTTCVWEFCLYRATHQYFCRALSVELDHWHIPLPDKMRNCSVSQEGAELGGVLWGGSRLQRESRHHHT